MRNPRREIVVCDSKDDVLEVQSRRREVKRKLRWCRKRKRSVEVLDGNGVMRAVVFAADNNGKSGLELKDANGNVKLSIHMNQRHDAFVNILDANGRSRIEIGISPAGDAYLVLRKGDGTVVHSLVAPN